MRIIYSCDIILLPGECCSSNLGGLYAREVLLGDYSGGVADTL